MLLFQCVNVDTINTSGVDNAGPLFHFQILFHCKSEEIKMPISLPSNRYIMEVQPSTWIVEITLVEPSHRKVWTLTHSQRCGSVVLFKSPIRNSFLTQSQFLSTYNAISCKNCCILFQFKNVMLSLEGGIRQCSLYRHYVQVQHQINVFHTKIRKKKIRAGGGKVRASHQVFEGIY